MLGILPPEIAKLIHDYVLEDVLNELLMDTKELKSINDNNANRKNQDEDNFVHIIGWPPQIGWPYRKFTLVNFSCIYIFPNKELIKRKINFLKKYNNETKFKCCCGDIMLISEHTEKDILYT